MRNIENESRRRSAVQSTLMIVACFVLGLLAGGMLLIGVSLLRFWKSLTPSDFQTWFASHSHLIGGLMIPLGAAGIVVTVAAIVAIWRRSATERRWLFIAAILTLSVIVTYPLFFQTTNETFVRGGLSDSMIRSLLGRWETWHWIRTVLGMSGFVAALRALHG